MNRLNQNSFVNQAGKRPTPSKQTTQAQGILVTLNKSREIDEENKHLRRESGTNSQQAIHRKIAMATTPRTLEQTRKAFEQSELRATNKLQGGQIAIQNLPKGQKHQNNQVKFTSNRIQTAHHTESVEKLQNEVKEQSPLIARSLGMPVQGNIRTRRQTKDLPTKRSEIFDFLLQYSNSSPVQSLNPYVVSTSPPHEGSFMSTSAESNKQGTSSSLLRHEESKYLEFYGKEQFQDLQANEYKCQFSALMHNQQEITRHLRASVIDWLFEVGTKLNIEDKGVIFQAINLMDRYYDKQVQQLPTKDLQLTAVTSLFIASKNLEVDPLDLQTCAKTLCFNKYAKAQFLKKESDIRIAVNYENESPSVLDFMMFYLRMVKYSVQKQIECLPETSTFIGDVTTIVYDLSKSLQIDANLFKYKPSILAACLLFLGFQLQFEILMQNGTINLLSKQKKEFVSQLCTVFRHWRFNVLEKILCVDEIPKIMTFCEHVMTRQIALFEEYRETFPNIYKERVAEYIKAPQATIMPEVNFKQSKTDESPVLGGDEDVEMLDESDAIPCAQTFDDRRRRMPHDLMSNNMMIIQQ